MNRMRSYQCDLLEFRLELVEAVDRRRQPTLYSRRAWMQSLTGIATRFSISIPPFGSVKILRLFMKVTR